LQNRHQWEVEDLRKAGLNPILSAHSAPSIGSSAKADTVSVSDKVSQGVNSALAARRARAEIEQINSQTSLNKAAERTQDTQGVHNLASARAADAQAATQLQWQGIRKPLSDVQGLVGQATGKFSSLANSAAAAARQVPRFLTHGLPGIVRRRVFSR